jgi:hypothetical protein
MEDLGTGGDGCGFIYRLHPNSTSIKCSPGINKYKTVLVWLTAGGRAGVYVEDRSNASIIFCSIVFHHYPSPSGFSL